MGLFEPEPHEEQASQLLFPDFRFGLDPIEKAQKLVDLGVGGFCLFSGGKDEISRFTEAMQKRAKRPLVFCADYEAGTGRLVADGTRLPANMAFGAAGSEELAELKGKSTAREAKALGVDWVLAPVVDLATRADNPIVNTRAFGADPARVTRLARAFLGGLHAGQAAGCLKHFPGHGETHVDSHIDLPVLDRSVEELQSAELVPYRELAREADSVMLGHLVFPKVEAGVPATLSAKAVELVRALGFRGVVVTDALLMGAVADRYTPEELVVRALKAGVDILLVPRDPFETHTAILSALEKGDVGPEEIEERFQRLEALRKACGLGDGAPYREGPRAVGTPEGNVVTGKVAQAALCWHGAPFSVLRPGESVAYLELGSEGPPWKGQAMLDRLQRLSVSWRPFEEGWRGPVLASSFTNPRAWAGTINLPEDDVSKLKLASWCGPTALVSFGSPFVAEQVAVSTLLAFSDEPLLQQAAAGVLTGKEAPRGRCPVPLRPQPLWPSRES